MELPGILLFKEQGFPFASLRPSGNANRDASSPDALAWKVRWLEWAFGAPTLEALSRNVVTYQAVARGPGARALDYVCEELGRIIFSNPDFSLAAAPNLTAATDSTAHSWNVDAGIGPRIVETIGDLAGSQDSRFKEFRPIFGAEYFPWERAFAASLADMDFDGDPSEAVRAFELRADATARSLLHLLGRNRTFALLAELRRRGGGAYTADDFNAALIAVDADTARLIGDWLTEVGLPGFLVSRARIERVAADDQGRSRYEVRVHVRNGESVRGLVRLSLGLDRRSLRSEPIGVEGDRSVEIGFVTPEPPKVLWLEPYLSLNRVPIRVEFDDVDEQSASEREPFVGSRPSVWLPSPGGLVVDDLDPGFFVEHRPEDHDGRVGVRESAPSGRKFDRELPATTVVPGQWTRVSLPASWGKYRHTATGTIAGDGGSVAVFEADLPSPGRWQLDYHVPNRHSMGPNLFPTYGALGSFDMTLVADGRRSRVDFDGAVAEAGWNKVGEFDLTSTDVRVEVSSQTDGAMVVADAIRWVPMSGVF